MLKNSIRTLKSEDTLLFQRMALALVTGRAADLRRNTPNFPEDNPLDGGWENIIDKEKPIILLLTNKKKSSSRLFEAKMPDFQISINPNLNERKVDVSPLQTRQSFSDRSSEWRWRLA